MIIFIYGEDTFRSKNKLKELKNKFSNDVDSSGSSVVYLDGESLSVEKLNEASATSSLFANKRMIVVENIFSNKMKTIREDVFNYLKSKQDSENIFIFIDDTSGAKLKTNKLFKYLSTQKFTQEFKSLSNTDATSWVKTEIEKRGGSITRQVAMHLTSIFGSDLWQLHNEINKIINYKKGLGVELEVNVSDIEELSRGMSDENIFALTDAISNKNKRQALELFEKELEAGVAENYLVHMITRQFRVLMQIKEGLDQGLTPRMMVNQLKMHPFVVQKSSTQVKNFSLDLLKRIFKKMTEIDKNFKTGKVDPKTEISLLIVKI